MDFTKAAPASIFNHLFTPDMMAMQLEDGKTVGESSARLIDQIAEIQSRDPGALSFIARVRENYAVIEGLQGTDAGAVPMLPQSLQKWSRKAAIWREEKLEQLTPSAWRAEKRGCIGKLGYLLSSGVDLRQEERLYQMDRVMRGGKIAGGASLAMMSFAFALSPEGRNAGMHLLQRAHVWATASAGAVAVATAAPHSPTLLAALGAAPRVVFKVKSAVNEVRQTLFGSEDGSPIVAQLQKVWLTDRLAGESIEKTRERVEGVIGQHMERVGHPQDLDAVSLARAQPTYEAIGRWLEATCDRDLQASFGRLLAPAQSTAVSKPSV